MISPIRLPTLFSCIVLLHLLAACGDPRFTEYRLAGPTMGTQFTVAIAAGSGIEKEHLRQQIHAALADVDERMSTFRADSEVARFNRSLSTDWMPVSLQLCDAVARSLELSVLTGGAFDITIGALVNLWGFGPADARIAPPADADIDAAKLITGFDKLHADCDRPAIRKDHPDLHIDLSGYAKGLAADNIAILLDESGIANFLVEVGGDLHARGHNADGLEWRVAIEKPDGNGRMVKKIIRLSEGSVATSGDYRNYFESDGRRFSHTIDPATGRPVIHQLASVTVVSHSAAHADALATALMVLGPENGLAFAERHGLAAYFLLREGNEITERASTRFELLSGR